MTRLRYRLLEAFTYSAGLVAVDGLLHLCEGKPFISEFMLGGALSAFLLRGADAIRAASKQWPET